MIPPDLFKIVFLIEPIGNLELGQFAGQIHERNGDYLGLPLQTQRGRVAVVDERPGHLNHAAYLLLIAFERFGVLEQITVRMIDLQVKFDRLQQNFLVRHDLFDAFVRKIVGMFAQTLALQIHFGRTDQIATLFGRLFHFARQEQATRRHRVARKFVERVEHVETMKKHHSRCHRIIASFNRSTIISSLSNSISYS